MNNHPTSTEPSRRGVVRDLSRLKHDGTASAAEVREFLRQMRGRSPQEVLGSVAQSSLVHGVTVATVATLVLFFAFTAGPYFAGKTRTEKKIAPAAAAAKRDEPAAQKSAEQAPASTATAEPEKKPSDKALDVLGVSETKDADPGKNPLEDKGDDLLKDLK